MNAINPSEEVTVVVRRHILPGHEGQFEHAMRDFVNFVLSCPGHVGISVLRPSDGNGEYVVVDRFASAAARKALVSSPEYERWMKLLGAHTEGGGPYPGDERPGRLVEPAGHPDDDAAALQDGGGHLSGRVPGHLSSEHYRGWAHSQRAARMAFLFFLFNACVVALLTWVFMPLISSILSPWLFRAQAGTIPGTTPNHDENNEKQ